jgi:hypothetical protein
MAIVQVPILGFRILARLGLFAAAAVAVPIVIRKCKPLAEKLGDTLINAGEQLKPEPEATRRPEVKDAEPAKVAPKSSTRRKSQTKRRVAAKVKAKKPE